MKLFDRFPQKIGSPCARRGLGACWKVLDNQTIELQAVELHTLFLETSLTAMDSLTREPLTLCFVEESPTWLRVSRSEHLAVGQHILVNMDRQNQPGKKLHREVPSRPVIRLQCSSDLIHGSWQEGFRHPECGRRGECLSVVQTTFH